MIINLLINFVLIIVGGLASFLPVVMLPDQFRDILITISGYYHNFMDIMPFLQLPFTLFIWVILPFELSLILAKVLLGHRMPKFN